MDFNKRFFPFIILGILILAGLWITLRTDSRKIDKNTYQAVFLENNQLYFGKLSSLSGQYVTLSDIYYFQETNKDPKTPLTLIKYGNEVHTPQDVMQINRDRIILWQNIKPEGRVVQLIYQQKLQAAANLSAGSR